MTEISSILVVRLSAIGDIVMASPLLGALRKRYPKAHIAWLVQAESRTLLEHQPDLDEVIVWPRADWRRMFKQRQWSDLWQAVYAFRQQLHSRQFDLAIDAQGLLKSGFLTWLSGAKQRVGLGSREGSQWLMTRVIDRGGDSKRIGSEYLYLAQQLHLPTDSFEMHVALSQVDNDYVRDLVATEDLQSGYLVICPFTTRPQKHWFAERWIELAARLETLFGWRVILLGGPGDVAEARRIEQALGPRLVNQVGVTSLTQAAALISQSKLLIGVDTGLTHMGIACNRPTIALFGSTCPYLDTTHENAVVLYHKLACSPCKRNPTCNNRFDCMAAISVEEVLAQAGSLLNMAGAGR
jgi:heptosyltransferase-1